MEDKTHNGVMKRVRGKEINVEIKKETARIFPRSEKEKEEKTFFKEIKAQERG